MKQLLVLFIMLLSLNIFSQDSSKSSIKFTGIELKFNNSFQVNNLNGITPSIGLRTGIKWNGIRFSISLDNNLNSKMIYFYKNWNVSLEISYKIIH